MTQRERLIEIIQKSVGGCAEYWAGKIADGLIESGIIIPPCKVGDSVYRLSSRHLTKIKYIEKSKISRIAVDKDDIYLFCECNPIAKCIFNKTVFLSREEAEKALKDCKND